MVTLTTPLTMDKYHWSEVSLPTSIKLTPKFFLGCERKQKIKVTKKGKISWREAQVEFDKDFIVSYISKMLADLYPLHPEKIEVLLKAVLISYRKIYMRKKQNESADS